MLALTLKKLFSKNSRQLYLTFFIWCSMASKTALWASSAFKGCGLAMMPSDHGPIETDLANLWSIKWQCSCL